MKITIKTPIGNISRIYISEDGSVTSEAIHTYNTLEDFLAQTGCSLDELVKSCGKGIMPCILCPKLDDETVERIRESLADDLACTTPDEERPLIIRRSDLKELSYEDFSTLPDAFTVHPDGSVSVAGKEPWESICTLLDGYRVVPHDFFDALPTDLLIRLSAYTGRNPSTIPSPARIRLWVADTGIKAAIRKVCQMSRCLRPAAAGRLVRGIVEQGTPTVPEQMERLERAIRRITVDTSPEQPETPRRRIERALITAAPRIAWRAAGNTLSATLANTPIEVGPNGIRYGFLSWDASTTFLDDMVSAARSAWMVQTAERLEGIV